MMAIGYVMASAWWLTSAGEPGDEEPAISNPFQLAPALRFGVLLAVVMLAAHALESWTGEAGLYVLALASGLTDVDAITLSLARLAGQDTAVAVAATGIVLAAMANTVFKAGLVIAVGGGALGWRAGVSAGVTLLGGTVALML